MMVCSGTVTELTGRNRKQFKCSMRIQNGPCKLKQLTRKLKLIIHTPALRFEMALLRRRSGNVTTRSLNRTIHRAVVLQTVEEEKTLRTSITVGLLQCDALANARS